MLGTGNALVTECYNTCFVISDGDKNFLVADGEAVNVIGHATTFFDIRSTKTKQFGFSMDIGGGKLTCCGDEPCNDFGKVYAENAAWLLHEAFCLHSQADIFDPYGKNHSTVKDACELAQKLHVKNLLLYHTEDKNLPARKDLYRAEGQKYFSGRIHVPDDLETLAL